MHVELNNLSENCINCSIFLVYLLLELLIHVSRQNRLKKGVYEMSIRYQIPTGTERVNHLIFVLCAIIIGAMFFGTALLFSPSTPEMVYQELTGVSKELPIVGEDSTKENKSNKTQSPQVFATGVFMSLAFLLALFAVRSLLISIFDTIALLEIVVFFLAISLLFGFGYCIYQTFAIGGFYGILPLSVLIVEGAIAGYPSYKIYVSRTHTSKSSMLF